MNEVRARVLVRRRRSRWQRLLALLAVAVVLAAACGGDDDDDDAAPSGGGSVDGEATIRHGVTSPVPHFDAHRHVHVGWYEQLYPLYDTLIGIDGDGEFVNSGLAEEWEVSDDGMSITLTLRDGATFHDGSPIDAAAVKANLERAKSLAGSTVAVLLESVASVQAPDARTVELRLSRSDASVIGALTTPAGMVMNPRGFTGEFPTDLASTRPLGSGAYELVEWRPNQAEIFEKWDGYWDQDVVENAPRRVELHFVADANAKISALRTGAWESVQASGIEEQIVTLTESDDRFVFDPRKGSAGGVFLDLDNPPFNNPLARQAVAHAINAEELTSTLLVESCGEVANAMLSDDHWSVPSDLERAYSYDAARARQLVQQLGGLSFRAVFSPGTLGEAISSALQAQFEAVGMDVDIVGVPGGQSVPSFLRNEHNALVNFATPRPDPALMFSAYYTAGWDVSRSTEVERLAQRASDGALSREQRADLYGDLWDMVNEEAGFVPICYTTSGPAHRSNIDGFENTDITLSPHQDWRQIRVRSE